MYIVISDGERATWRGKVKRMCFRRCQRVHITWATGNVLDTYIGDRTVWVYNTESQAAKDIANNLMEPQLTA
jgi:hypothetical protein